MDRCPEILVIEDDEDEIVVALRAFRRGDLLDRVEVHRDGERALAALEARDVAPKVVLLDLRMPRLDGRDVLRRMRAQRATRIVPVVVISSSSDPRDIAECYELGANSYVIKQYGTAPPGAWLLDVVRYWLQINRPATRGV